jgi:hypothetical protein
MQPTTAAASAAMAAPPGGMNTTTTTAAANANGNNVSPNHRHLAAHEITQLQQFMQGQLTLALASEDHHSAGQLDGHFLPSSSSASVDSALFSPSQQSRTAGGEATKQREDNEAETTANGIANPPMSNSAKLLASAFLLDQQQTGAVMNQGGSGGGNG